MQIDKRVYISLIATLLSLSTLQAKSHHTGSLSGLCKRAVQNSPKILGLRHKENASIYATEQLYDRYKPQISISAGGGYERYDEKFSSGRKVEYEDKIYNYEAKISQTIYRPTLLKSIDNSRLKERASRLQREDQQAQLVVMLAQTAIERMRLQQIVKLNKKKVVIYKKALDQIASKFSMRLSNKSELNQAKARLQRAIADLAQTKQMIMMTDANLRLLSKVRNISPSIFNRHFRIDSVKRHYNKIGLKSLKKMINKNSTVKLSKAYVDIALSEVETRKAERYPTIDVSAGYSGSHGADETTVDRRSRVMVNINFPIFQGGYVTDRVNEAKELYLAATQDLSDRIINSEMSLEKYWLQIKSALHTYQAQKAAEKATKIYFESAKSAYVQGLQSLTDAYLAEADYYDAQVSRINTGADILKSILNIYYVIGKADYKSIAQFEKRYLR